MATGPIRNPLAGFALAILEAALLSGIAGFGSTFVPYTEFRLFVLGFALFGIGVFSGRKTYMGTLGFVGGYLGGFVGVYVAEQFFWTNPWMELIALGLALAAGLGGLVTGKLGVLKLDRMQRVAPGQRRCRNCGSRVGVSAHKCWSCKASLPT